MHLYLIVVLLYWNICQADPVADRLTAALINPKAAVHSYPDARQARSDGFGSLASALGGAGQGQGSSNSFFNSMFSTFSGIVDKVGTVLGAPQMPNEIKKAMADGPRSPAIGGSGPGPRMTRPGPEVYRAAAAKRFKLKHPIVMENVSRVKRQGVSVSAFKNSFMGEPGQIGKLQDTPAGKEVYDIFSALSAIFHNLGTLGRTPVSRMKDRMQGFGKKAERVVNKAIDLPNTVMGQVRSKRQTPMEIVPVEVVPVPVGFRPDSENEVHHSLTELAVAHQENWFTYLRSFNGSTIDCHEWDFCRTARGNNEFQTPVARSGGKMLSYLTSGMRDQRGQIGTRLLQAVDCCLSENQLQADSCENHYYQRCLETEPEYTLSRLSSAI